MTVDINRLVDDILNESPKPETVLFTVPGDLSGFSRAIQTIKNYPCDDRTVVFCESIENLVPEPVLKETANGMQVLSTKSCVPGDVVDNATRVVVPILPGTAAEKLVGDNAAGMLPAIWREARRKGIPMCADLADLKRAAGSDAAALARVHELEQRLKEMGIENFCATSLNGTSGEAVAPELELVGELVHHLCEQCETEDGVSCTDCGMCKVRGF